MDIIADPMTKTSKGHLYHQVPAWVGDGQVFHVRIRIEENSRCSLIAPEVPRALLNSVHFYEQSGRWHCHLFLLMPDHLHALFSFPVQTGMSKTISGWKAYHARHSGIVWQSNYFDHRIRNASEFELKATYIRNNPVVKGPCTTAAEWPWVTDVGQASDV